MKIVVNRTLKASAMAFFAMCLVACSTQGLDAGAGSSDVAVSDSGAVVQTVSDAGGTSIEADDLIPESVKAIKAPNKDDYPGWDGPDISGAEPLTKLFIDSLLYAYSTGDTAPVEELYDPAKCLECEDIIQEIHGLDSEKIYFDHGYANEALALEVIKFDEETKIFTVLYKFTLPEYSEYEAGEFVKKYDARLFYFNLDLHNPGDGWLVVDIRFKNESLP